MNKKNQGGKFPWLLGEQYYANILQYTRKIHFNLYVFFTK